MTDKPEFAIVNTTVKNKKEAEQIAGEIVGQKLAACVQFFPIMSIYRWQGAVESADEYFLVAKTTKALAGRLVDFIKSVHSYEVPEIIITPVTGGFKGYLDWIAAETEGGAGKKGEFLT